MTHAQFYRSLPTGSKEPWLKSLTVLLIVLSLVMLAACGSPRIERSFTDEKSLCDYVKTSLRNGDQVSSTIVFDFAALPGKAQQMSEQELSLMTDMGGKLFKDHGEPKESLKPVSPADLNAVLEQLGRMGLKTNLTPTLLYSLEWSWQEKGPGKSSLHQVISLYLGKQGERWFSPGYVPK